MTKPAMLPPVPDVVEIDAMDVAEWESGQRTPQASDANLAELVRKTAAPPEPAAPAQTAARERPRTQAGASVIARPSSRAGTVPPAPAPKPARPSTSVAPPAPPARTTRVPDMPAAPRVEPKRSPAPARSAIGASLPAIATGEASIRPSEPEPRRSPAPEPRRPQPAASSGIDFSLPVTATSDSGTQLPEPEPLPPTPPTSPFAEPSQVGPGHNASPAGRMDPNTAWPPRPIPVDARQPPVRRAAPDAASLPPGREHARRADRRQVAQAHRRRWWIVGGLAAASLAGVIAAALLPGAEAPPQASQDGRRPQAAQPPAPPIDRGDPAELAPARPAQAPAAPAAGAAIASAGAVERQPTPPAAGPDATMQLRSTEPAAAAAPHPRHAGAKPAARKLVIDYTTRPDETPPPSLVAQSEEDPAIGRARSAYSTGNQRLFAGDLTGAVRAYRQALELYPGYVAGYRGLGLAYEELGDTARALAALRAYVAEVPSARDTALIRKRIAHLQRR